jgi:hypothetical protein
MIYVTDTTSSVPACAYEIAGKTASAEVERKWLEEVLPHFLATASRQRVLEATIPPPMLVDEDVELESPPFTPTELTEFAARGFQRRNRWVASGRKR